MLRMLHCDNQPERHPKRCSFSRIEKNASDPAQASRMTTEISSRQAFERWTRGRALPSIGTNAGAGSIAFQDWKKFKEAFAPELILRAVRESSVHVKRVLDPFGGSGTTALACQFLGVHPTTVEVNPFLADLIRAKLALYDVGQLRDDADKVLTTMRAYPSDALPDGFLPPTFVEPGSGGRWLFSAELFTAFRSIQLAIAEVDDSDNRRLFRVLLGGLLVDVSNVRVSGKGRRYRANWQLRETPSFLLFELFEESLRSAMVDIGEHGCRAETKAEVVEGDSRSALSNIAPVDLVVFSPPYPNSFDYTDVYNVELWMLGYLQSWDDNKTLRESTLSSHVQVKREFAGPPSGSPLLEQSLEALEEVKDQLWDRQLPLMIGAYFGELLSVIEACAAKLVSEGEMWIVVGDSRYAGVDIRVARIMAELTVSRGFETVSIEPFRSMRTSPQQGGREGLDESLVILRKH